MNIKQEIIEFCNKLGLDTVGFIKARVFNELEVSLQESKDNKYYNEFAEQDLDKRINPFTEYERGKTIISIAFPYLYDMKYEENGFSLYTRGMDYHYVVNKYLNLILDFIKSKGGDGKVFCDSNNLPERHIAYLAGIGFVGKNNMIITEKYGSYVFLGEIITDLEMDTNERDYLEIKQYKECGSCNNCLRRCPTKAIQENKKNSNICLSYITQKKEIEDKWFNLLNGRVFGCDTCQLSCPYNNEIKFSNIKEFKPFEYMNNKDTDWILGITNKEFKDTLKITSCGWRGKNVLMRNVVIKKVTIKKEKVNTNSLNSPYVKEYYNRLL